MTISIVVSVVQNSREPVYVGACVNLGVTEEGQKYLTDGLFEKFGGNPKKDRIELTPMGINTGASAMTDIEMSSPEKLLAMVTTGELDYLLLDAYALTYCGNDGLFAPLEESISKEMLAKFEGKLVTLRYDDTEYVAAIDISDLPFVKKNLGTKDKVYIAFPGNTSRTDKNEAFLQYLMDWTE